MRASRQCREPGYLPVSSWDSDEESDSLVGHTDVAGAHDDVLQEAHGSTTRSEVAAFTNRRGDRGLLQRIAAQASRIDARAWCAAACMVALALSAASGRGQDASLQAEGAAVRDGRLRAPASLAEWKQVVGCGTVEDNVEYHTASGGEELSRIDKVMSSEECRKKCEKEPRCSMWTWGKTKDIAIAGMSDVCFLKELTELENLRRRANDLAVSGLSCQLMAGENFSTVGANATDASGDRRRRRRKAHGNEPQLFDANASCEETLDGTEVRTARSVDQVAQVKTAFKCRQLCGKTHECSVWTWGKASAGIEGLSSACLMWALEEGQEPELRHNPGSVSGARCGHHPGLSLSKRSSTTSSPPYDCQAGYSNWHAGWSQSKKKWCCSSYQMGCTEDVSSSTATLTVTATATATLTRSTTTSANSTSTLPTTTPEATSTRSTSARSAAVSDPYDCQAGYSNWQAGWSDGKKLWCCQHRQTGCETTSSEPYDCQAGYSNWQAGWSDGKKRWCCALKDVGCEQEPSTVPTTVSLTTSALSAFTAVPTMTFTTSVVSSTSSLCEEPEDGVEYRTRGNLSRLGFVDSASACSSLCSSAPACGAWTWGKAHAQVGVRNVCFLKRLQKGEWPQKHARSHLVSGYACRSDGGEPLLTVAAAAAAEPVADEAGSLQAGEAGAWCADSPPQRCRRICPRPACDQETCATRSGNCCDFRCVHGAGKATSTTGEEIPTSAPSTTTVQTSASPAEDTGNSRENSSIPIYCFELMKPEGYEPELVAHQFHRKASIFACDRWSLFSSMVMEVTPGLETTAVKSDLKCEVGGEFQTALNTDVFMAVWAEVISQGLFEKAAWTVKVDPDCVFFPARLRPKLNDLQDDPQGVYLNNCALGMHGPLEVFSRNAVTAWAGGAERCAHHFQQMCNGPCLWGEDMFIDQCLWKVMKAKRLDDLTLLQEAHCAPPPGWTSCKDPQFAGFHPFKEPAEWLRCFEGASHVTNATVL